MTLKALCTLPALAGANLLHKFRGSGLHRVHPSCIFILHLYDSFEKLCTNSVSLGSHGRRWSS